MLTLLEGIGSVSDVNTVYIQAASANGTWRNWPLMTQVLPWLWHVSAKASWTRWIASLWLSDLTCKVGIK